MISKLVATLTLVVFCGASTVVVRDSFISLPVARHFNFNASAGSTLLDFDQLRARTLKSRTKTSPDQFEAAASASPKNIPVTNIVDAYTAEVKVGDPARTFNLLIDTGSSNTFVGTNLTGNPFVPSRTTTELGELSFIEFGSGDFFGFEVIDTITFGGITIPRQEMGAAISSSGFAGVDGILGIGPTDLTDDTTTGGGTVPTVTDNAFSLGIIPAKQVGISFEPTTSLSITNGQLTFGGIDKSRFTGPLETVPITTTSPASEFVGINQTVRFGDTVILPQTAGIVDTGTTLLLLASNALATYENLTGAVLDETTGLLSITAEQFANLKSLFFDIGSTSFEFTPNAQLWPRALNSAIGGDPDSIYLIVGDLGTDSGEGLDFINGFAFLERFFAVFDSGANTVSFATTPFTFATTN